MVDTMSGVTSPLNKWAQSSPSLLALQTPERDFTWLQLLACVNGVANSLSSQGIASGDVVVAIGKNSVELLILHLACSELGAVCAPTMPQSLAEVHTKLSVLYSPEEHHWIWVDSALGREDLSGLRTVSVALSEHVEVKPVDSQANPFERDRIASIIFTSGSTGTPKAVAHSTSQHLASAEGLLSRFAFQQHDTWLLSLPMYHVSGLAIVYRWLLRGACLKLGEGELGHDIQGVTHASLVATQLKRLLGQYASLDLTHILLGGSHIPHDLALAANSKGIETWIGYGMTEAASTVTAKRVDDQCDAGSLLPRRQIKIENQRIYIGGETLAEGYYKQGVCTSIVDESGWFDSKDLGEWLGERIKIIGRADNLFISGGENVHCEEIEAVINQIYGVKTSIVIPIADSEYGHRPAVVIDSSKAVEQRNIESYLVNQLAKFKWPIAYYTMPKSLLGNGIKISRKAVKEWLQTQLK
ncbi:o-succinylbenzoate--CoA ligase [Vibrio maerlii]|uniref:o-succinylbenzoate--CoA ligase n=1 Tax=Vibrio maerlii TaxID=2231648 RepID=UPI0019D299DB|nr:o-succinylbenzoate--CoA ligase [Vibrio maerlii]